jgi:hypothetical protein
MSVLRSTLLSDGSSDRVLIPILDWLLQSKITRLILSETKWADFGYRRAPPGSLEEKIVFAVEDYPCDLLFVHRDAEAQDPANRKMEILNAVRLAGIQPPVVCVIPVRMSEAWLLLDEMAIRSASGNPRGRMPLNLPAPNAVEQSADPKEVLFQALRVASAQTGRRLRALDVHQRRHTVAERMNFHLLRSLPAFVRLETELSATLDANDWN